MAVSSTHRIDQRFQVEHAYPVCFTKEAFHPANPLLADLLAEALPARGRTGVGAGERMRVRVLMVLDDGVARGQPRLAAQMARYAAAHDEVIELVREPWLVRGGEAAKTEAPDVEAFYALVCGLGLCRHSVVIVVGGGAVLDAIGYAAATAHRGIRLLRMPSTVLGQNDAGVGVKNAINWGGRKNFLGTFVPPFAVVNDQALLASAPATELRAGIAEAVKVALIRDRTFFERLHADRLRLARVEPDAMAHMIRRCAELHLAQIRHCGDPFERGSARPLDFGHWSAHKLEELSQHALRHGEAVAMGVALDALYSHRTGLLGEADLQRILETLQDIGFALYHPAFERLDIARALHDFREHLGGELCITLLAGLGRGVEVDHIDTAVMADCVAALASFSQRTQAVACL